MKKILLLGILVAALCSCNKSTQTNTTELDSVSVDTTSINATSLNDERNDKIVYQFFKDYQKTDSNWVQTKKGRKRMAEAFKNRITTDIEFAKACANYKVEGEYLCDAIADKESIAAYNKDDGEEGEIKAFNFIFTIPLIKPYYDGTKEVYVRYEIISCIPSTVEEHWKPYTKTATCCKTSTKYFNECLLEPVYLGSYIVAKDK